MVKGKRFKPTTGEIYLNRNGKIYLCGDVWDNNTPEPSYCARMTNTATGWTSVGPEVSRKLLSFREGGRYETDLIF